MVECRAIELEVLTQAVRALRTVNPSPVAVSGLAFDTRGVTLGALFFCVPGLTVDGHAFAGEAIERGAVALVVERELPLAVPQIVVADAHDAMGRAADVFFDRPTRELDVVGVTGTNGKTTTTFLLFAALAASGQRPGLVGTIEGRVGGERRAFPGTTPAAIDLQRTFREMVDAGDRSCAIETSSHASQQRRLVGTRFAALVFTNLSQDHLDYHETMDAYFHAKRRLFIEPDVDGRQPPAVVNVDDPWGARLADELRDLGGELVTFGLDSEGDVRAEAVEVGPTGSTFTVDELAFSTCLRGRFNVSNALGVVAAGRVLGLQDEAIRRGIEHVTGVPGRFEAVDEGQPFAVVVDYAHTPEGLANVLGEARALAAGRVICVFGCGGDRDRGKRPLMGEIASRLADLAIVTSDNPRSEDPNAIIDEIVAGAAETPQVEPDRAAAIELALDAAREGDIVVIAGKGHELGQEIAGRTIPFDDREVARDLLRRLRARASA